MKFFIYIGIILVLFTCVQKEAIMSQSKFRKKTPDNKYTSCLLIEKEFVNKIGKSPGFKELYLRCSIQDYFIKLCESRVSLEQLKKYIGSGITVEMKILNGNWDICPGDDQRAQSRTGPYVIINKIKDL